MTFTQSLLDPSDGISNMISHQNLDQHIKNNEVMMKYMESNIKNDKAPRTNDIIIYHG